jgi:hypothetical protein
LCEAFGKFVYLIALRLFGVQPSREKENSDNECCTAPDGSCSFEEVLIRVGTVEMCVAVDTASLLGSTAISMTPRQHLLGMRY